MMMMIVISEKGVIGVSETYGSTHDPPLGHNRTEGGEGDVPLRKRPDLEGQSVKKNVRKTHPGRRKQKMRSSKKQEGVDRVDEIPKTEMFF
jgi:hypothetical protein